MKKFIPSLTFLFVAALSSLQANPEVPQAVTQSFGSAIADSILLIKGSSTTAEPVEWTAYARDPFRPADILRISVTMEGIAWKASPAGAGTKILDRVPATAIDFSKLLYRSADARVVAAKSAALAQTTFTSIDYQLATNAETGAPEWGMALKDETGYEVGFVVVSATTGAVSFQDWSPRVPSSANAEGDEGERAARAVKRAARKTWDWTDNARKETRGFFRELFR
ncbi:hypothetical protein EI77_02726 [Prosthecobacter fusiformis]|uniref:Uncharacterized protein n=1 Tax=Prosthecobacter fusiformis TaxID=48464 RepID=A0A4R7RZY9_9BACT|nr:hypothetical protein [Prosthecobacter fusiformis]TDU70678.1 hypothetical protein EI77_02726 [Prosthecobacter fusiformis]